MTVDVENLQLAYRQVEKETDVFCGSEFLSFRQDADNGRHDANPSTPSARMGLAGST